MNNLSFWISEFFIQSAVYEYYYRHLGFSPVAWNAFRNYLEDGRLPFHPKFQGEMEYFAFTFFWDVLNGALFAVNICGFDGTPQKEFYHTMVETYADPGKKPKTHYLFTHYNVMPVREAGVEIGFDDEILAIYDSKVEPKRPNLPASTQHEIKCWYDWKQELSDFRVLEYHWFCVSIRKHFTLLGHERNNMLSSLISILNKHPYSYIGLPAGYDFKKNNDIGIISWDFNGYARNSLYEKQVSGILGVVAEQDGGSTVYPGIAGFAPGKPNPGLYDGWSYPFLRIYYKREKIKSLEFFKPDPEKIIFEN